MLSAKGWGRRLAGTPTKPEASAEVEANKGKIKQKKSKLYELEQKVMENKKMIYGERAFVKENRQILKNYAVACMDTRQMISQNKDDIFKNCYAIFKTLRTSSQIDLNFRKSKINEAKVDFLDHRFKLNAKVEVVSQKMAAMNAMLIEINDSVMESDGEIDGALCQVRQFGHGLPTSGE